MTPGRRKKRSDVSGVLSIAFAFVCLLLIASVVLLAQDAGSQVEAKASFDSICASCHGLDARGGERGPDIASRPEVVRKTDAELTEILKSGKPATGMPAFSFLGPAKWAELVAYLRTLQGRGAGASLPGNPAAGHTLFFGKAKCSGCHMVGGQGGFFARDLSTYAARLDAEQVRAKILIRTRSRSTPRPGYGRRSWLRYDFGGGSQRRQLFTAIADAGRCLSSSEQIRHSIPNLPW